MKKISQILIFLYRSTTLWAQTDYSKNWEDFFSYNNVQDFIKTGSEISIYSFLFNDSRCLRNIIKIEICRKTLR